jgi:hypothetical protein
MGEEDGKLGLTTALDADEVDNGIWRVGFG